MPIHNHSLGQCQFLHTRCPIYRAKLYGGYGDAMPDCMARSEFLHGRCGWPDGLPNGRWFDPRGIVRNCYRILRQQLDGFDLFHNYNPVDWGFLLYGGSGECRKRLRGHKLPFPEPRDDDNKHGFLHGVVGNSGQ